MFLLCPSENQNVVQIDHHNAFYYEVLEDMPRLVQKVTFYLSLGLMQTLLKPQQTSSLVKYLALRS